MSQNLVFLPVLISVMLTIVLYIALGVAKSRAQKQGLVNEERRSLYDDAWPEPVQKINNNIRNQFEVPVLFYVIILILWDLRAVDLSTHILAWGFVVSRIIHAWIHTGSNYVPLRRRMFTVGLLFVLALALSCFKAVFMPLAL